MTRVGLSNEMSGEDNISRVTLISQRSLIVVQFDIDS